MTIRWVCKSFDDLSPAELYKILQLRNSVFIVEQACIYPDPDNIDFDCFHLCGWVNDTLAAYTRLIPSGKTFTEVSIGRVATHIDFRKGGFGRTLMQHSIDKCIEIFGRQDIRIGAQLYLKKFYESFGFEQCSDIYLEDGIEHIEMILLMK